MLNPRPVSLIAIALVALAGGALAISDGFNALERARGLEAAHDAEAQAPGLSRDDALNQAQQHLRQALAGRSHDAAAWLALAQVRLLQATGDTASGVSPVLAQDAAIAAAHAEQIAPHDAEPPARLALALSHLPAQRQRAAQALARSYALAPTNHDIARDRVEAGARVWSAAPLDLQRHIEDEACALAASGDVDVFNIARAAADPVVAAMFDALRQTPRCSPPPVAQ